MRLNLGLYVLVNVVSSDLNRLRVEFAVQLRLFRGVEFALVSLEAHREPNAALPIGIGCHRADKFTSLDRLDRRFDPINADDGNFAREPLSAQRLEGARAHIVISGPHALDLVAKTGEPRRCDVEGLLRLPIASLEIEKLDLGVLLQSLHQAFAAIDGRQV